MKLLVMSDSHGNTARMRAAAEREAPDAILHLGDHIGDARELQRFLPGTTMYMVKGNCDFYDPGETEVSLTLGGVKILMAHGHVYNVKSGLSALIDRARDTGTDLALFGHTHRPLVRPDGKRFLMNPGQMARHDHTHAATYGVVSIANGKFDCTIISFPK